MCDKPLLICVDCLCYLANGGVPEDRPDLPLQIDRNWMDWDVVLSGENGEDDEGSFSWSSCDCCGSDLGGDRYDAVAYKGSAPTT